MSNTRFIPWERGSIVLYDWERIAMMASGCTMEFIKAWVVIESDIKTSLRAATFQARGKHG